MTETKTKPKAVRKPRKKPVSKEENTPVEQEKVVDATPEKEQTYSDEQKAFIAYNEQLKKFHAALHGYSGSKKQLITTWMNAALSPLNAEEVKFSYPEQKELFSIFEELNAAKFILMVHGLERENRLKLTAPLINPVVNTEAKEA